MQHPTACAERRLGCFSRRLFVEIFGLAVSDERACCPFGGWYGIAQLRQGGDQLIELVVQKSNVARAEGDRP